MVTDAAREAKDKQRRERARQQLLKLNKKKREEKIAGLLKELSQQSELLSQRELVDPEEFMLMLEEAGHDSEEVPYTCVPNKVHFWCLCVVSDERGA